MTDPPWISSLSDEKVPSIPPARETPTKTSPHSFFRLWRQYSSVKSTTDYLVRHQTPATTSTRPTPFTRLKVSPKQNTATNESPAAMLPIIRG